MRPLGTVFDIEVEITTSRDSYTLGESFTATLHLVNNGSKDVWMNPIYDLPFLGNSVNNPEPNTGVTLLDWVQGAMIHVPPKSKIKLFERDFESQYSGEFIISCFGVEKTVFILDSESKGETVIAMMNKYSFKKTDEATLFITNVGLNRITLGDKYEIQKRDDDTWVEVPPSDYRDIWLSYLAILDSGDTFRQAVTIDSLEIGQYRVSKTVEDRVTQESITCIAEFEILEFLEKEYAWIKVFILTREPSPNLDIVELSSEDENVPRSLFEAIDKVLPDDESVVEGLPIDSAWGVHLYGISVAEADSIIHYFGDEIVEGRNTYEFYVSFVDYVFSIYIQFSRPFPTS
jgi:hypothetical protein